MTGPDDNAPAPQVLPDTDLTICLHCGYNLRRLPEGHTCPECGNPSDRESARQEVLDLVNQPMLKLGWRMFSVSSPLPVGWWWTVDRPEDLVLARLRTRQWLKRTVLAMAVFLFAINTFQIETTTVKYEHPPGDSSQRQEVWKSIAQYGRSSGGGVMPRPNPTWPTVTETTRNVVVVFEPALHATTSLFLLQIGVLPWLITRWVWFPLQCRHISARSAKLHLGSITTAFKYTLAPYLLLIVAEITALLILWTYTIGFARSAGLALMLLQCFAFLHTLLICNVWAAAVRSDRTGMLFGRKVAPILGTIASGGVGAICLLVPLVYAEFHLVAAIEKAWA
ncbi:MAG: hypothetical protein O7D91_12030 [Planctomycetota bacterium]|nr:hypothetical protein [Planctomycetota bacterium]